jgi:two-component system, sensor histidine kinase and response regulator
VESENHPPVEPAVNAAELLDRIGDDRLLLRDLLELFQTDSAAQVETCRLALANGDRDKVERAGHALKGMLANLAAPQAGKLAGRIEELGGSGDLTEITAILAQLREELRRVEIALANLCDVGSL